MLAVGREGGLGGGGGVLGQVDGILAAHPLQPDVAAGSVDKRPAVRREAGEGFRTGLVGELHKGDIFGRAGGLGARAENEICRAGNDAKRGDGQRCFRLPGPHRGRAGAFENAAGVAVALQAGEVGAEIGGGLVAKLAILLERLDDDAFQFGGGLRVESRR